MNKLFVHSILAIAVLGFYAATAQVVLPPPDSQGWIHLFRGTNTGDFYIANNGALPPAQSKLTFPNATYGARGDTIQVTGSPSGQIYFNQSFSHYRIRYQMHFPGAQGNCGMLMHVQQNDPTTNGFPRSMEAQGDPGQGMGELWAIGDLWVTVHAQPATAANNNFPKYDPLAADIVYGGLNWSNRCVTGKDGWGQPSYTRLAATTGWVQQEAYLYGSDSITVLVADTVRIKYRLPRVSSGGTPNNVTKYLTGGLNGWQSEGTPVWYRNMQIMLLPGDSLYNPTYVEFNRRNRITPMPSKKLLFKDGVLRFGNGMDPPRFDAMGRRPKLIEISDLRK